MGDRQLVCSRCLDEIADVGDACVMPSKAQTYGKFYHRGCCPDHGSPLSLGERAVNVLGPVFVMLTMFVFGLLVAGLITKGG